MANTDYNHVTSGKLVPINDHVIVVDMDNEDEKVTNGVIILNEQGGERGIHPRWAQVYAIGPDQEDVKEGEWILVEHGRWTRGVRLDDGKVYRKVDLECIMIVSDERPEE